LSTNLSLVSETRDGVEILLVSGEIDLSTAPRVGRALDLALAPGEALVVDLGGVAFMDSSGTRALAEAERAATVRGARLLLVASEFVAHVLDISGLRTAFEVHDDRDTALAVARGASDGAGSV
jgi:anti-sigma B factor antagonist